MANIFHFTSQVHLFGVVLLELVTQSCLTRYNPMDDSLPGSSDLGILQSRILEWVAICLMVKNLPAIRETWVRSLGWEDLLEKRMATHPYILAWRIRIPCTEEPGRLQPMGSQRIGHKGKTNFHCQEKNLIKKSYSFYGFQG